MLVPGWCFQANSITLLRYFDFRRKKGLAGYGGLFLCIDVAWRGLFYIDWIVANSRCMLSLYRFRFFSVSFSHADRLYRFR